LQTPWRAEDLRAVVNGSLATADSVGAPTTWVLSNHDVVRAASRLGYPTGTVEHGGIGIGDPQPDPALGLTRARSATLLMLALTASVGYPVRPTNWCARRCGCAGSTGSAAGT